MIRMDIYDLRNLLSKHAEFIKNAVNYDPEFLDDDTAIEESIEEFLTQEEAALADMEEPIIEESA